jgi:hypothetical protein
METSHDKSIVQITKFRGRVHMNGFSDLGCRNPGTSWRAFGGNRIWMFRHQYSAWPAEPSPGGRGSPPEPGFRGLDSTFGLLDPDHCARSGTWDDEFREIRELRHLETLMLAMAQDQMRV